MGTVTSDISDPLAGRVEDALAAMSSGRLDKLDEYFSENLIYHLTGQHRFSGTYEGRQDMLDMLAGVRSLFRTGIKYRVDRLITVDNTVVAMFVGTGTTATGEEYRNDYCSVWDFNSDARVTRITEYFDSHHVATVLSPGA